MEIGTSVTLTAPCKKVDPSIHWYHGLTGVIVEEYQKYNEHGYYRWRVKLDAAPFQDKEDLFWFDDCEVIPR